MKRKALLSSGLLVVLALAATPAHAQIDPGTVNENHYKVYELLPPVPPLTTGPFGLRDQFGFTDHETAMLEKFGIPAEKHLQDATGEVFPILDPFRHYTWWEFDFTEPFVRRVDVLDQFGGHSWRLRTSRYLLAPAGKNQADVPEGNHYKCYEADDAPIVNIAVGLVDQVDSVGVFVLHGEYFCNPADKTVGGVTYSMVDSTAHLTCYRVENTTPYDVTDVAVDQFGNRPIVLQQNTYLCVPAVKETVVGTESTTWGRIKSLYQR